MVSDSELIERLQDFLRNSDLNTTTNAIVRRKLEEDFGLDLLNRKAFIREQVDLFLQNELENAKQDGENVEDDDLTAMIKDEDEVNGFDSKEEEGDDGDVEDEKEEEVQQTGGRRGKRGSGSFSNEVKKRGSGFCKLCKLSPQLQHFFGVSEMARTEVVKQIWIYIREKNLQDPSNRRNILCDEALRALFDVDSINMFEMNKVLSNHIWSLDTDKDPTKSKHKQNKRKQEREDSDPDEENYKEKRQKGGKSGFLAPIQLSDALIKFLGTDESALSRSDVIKRMWDYIKQNNLQDQSDKRRVICDDKLKELFDVDAFIGFTVSKLLAAHFVKS